jgi:hypothetical protein
LPCNSRPETTGTLHFVQVTNPRTETVSRCARWAQGQLTKNAKPFTYRLSAIEITFDFLANGKTWEV